MSDLEAQIEAIRVNLIKGMSNKRAGKKPTMDEVAIIDAYNQLDYLRIEAKAHLDRDRKMKAELADEIHGVVLCLQADSVAIHQGLLSEPDALEEHWNGLKHYADSLETIQAAKSQRRVCSGRPQGTS